jgi:energy-coupling factor transporter transmembrane protein EcfT
LHCNEPQKHAIFIILFVVVVVVALLWFVLLATFSQAELFWRRFVLLFLLSFGGLFRLVFQLFNFILFFVLCTQKENMSMTNSTTAATKQQNKKKKPT